MKKLTVTVDGPKGSGVTRLANAIRTEGSVWDALPKFEVVDMSEVRDGRPDALAELEDLINDAIADSLDMDWTPKQGAKGVIAVLQREGYVVVQRGEDSEVAIAIGEHAFRGGFEAGMTFAASKGWHRDGTLQSFEAAAEDQAWSEYTPPEDLCGRALS